MSSSNNLIYKGPNLPCTGIDTWDEATVALQKLDDILCELTNQMYVIQQQINNYVNPPTSTSTTSTTTTIAGLPGRIRITNNSTNITINQAFIGNGFGNNDSLVFYSGSTFPLAPGQTGDFTVGGSGKTLLIISHSSNTGGGLASSNCNGSLGSTVLQSISAFSTVNFACPTPIPIGSIYTLNITQSS